MGQDKEPASAESPPAARKSRATSREQKLVPRSNPRLPEQIEIKIRPLIILNKINQKNWRFK
jgi:hypothetical protein